jgi:hypothetical protein
MSEIYKVIKLRSGEELIAEVAENENGKMTLNRPMVFKSVMLPDQYGMPKEGIILKNWLAFGNEHKTTIPVDFVATTLEPTQDVVQYYLIEKARQEIGYESKSLQEFTNESPTPPKMNNKHEKSVADYEEMISDMFDSIFKELEEEQEKPKKRRSKNKPSQEQIVHMSMVFPPQVLAHMINEGMIDPREIMDMIDYFGLGPNKNKRKRKNKRESINDQKFTGDETERKDFGNKWTDWNPDPDSDEYK